MAQTDCILVLTTLPADADATAFAATLVEERLAACVAVHPIMESIYRWQDGVERAHERQLVIKTSLRCRDALMARIRDLHAYDVPELLVLTVEGGGEAYLRWIGEETKKM